MARINAKMTNKMEWPDIIIIYRYIAYIEWKIYSVERELFLCITFVYMDRHQYVQRTSLKTLKYTKV